MATMLLNKYMVVSPSPTEVHSVVRTYSDKVLSDDIVAVSVNGQRISTDPTSKYYYSIIRTPATPLIQITINSNTAFSPPGYSPAPSPLIDVTFSVDDRIYIDYQYEVTI